MFNVCVWLRGDQFTRRQPSPLFVPTLTYTLIYSYSQPISPYYIRSHLFDVEYRFSHTELVAFASTFITLNTRQIGLCDIYLNERLLSMKFHLPHPQPYIYSHTLNSHYIAHTRHTYRITKSNRATWMATMSEANLFNKSTFPVYPKYIFWLCRSAVRAISSHKLNYRTNTLASYMYILKCIFIFK